MSEEVSKKAKPLNSIMKEIGKKFSKSNPDIIFDPSKQYEAISSGNIIYDIISGIGGFPKGRITEIVAMESVGKTSLLLAAIGKAQAKGQKCVLFDYEQCFDPYYAETCYGVKLDGETFFLFQPLSLEEGDTIFDMLMEADVNFDFMAFDSIACMLPQCIAEGSLNDNAQVGIHARFISRFFHKLKKQAYLRNTAVVCTNQMRHQIARDRFTPGLGVATGMKHDDQFTTPGGMAPRFLASIRMRMEPAGREENKGINPLTGETEDEKTTKKVKIINIKNKCARPELKEVSHFDIMTENQLGGWSSGKDVMALLRKRGRITQNGATFKYVGLNIPELVIRGKANGEKEFLTNPEVQADAFALLDKLREEDGSATLLVDKAIYGVDITDEDRKYQKETVKEDIDSVDESIFITAAGDTTL